MTTQWHPIFAKLLRPLVEPHYDVRTGVPVGDAPRLSDIVLVKRRRRGRSPFQGLWRHLTTWNVFEFKGPTDTALVRHIGALVELGLGIGRRLNEERAERRRRPLPEGEVAFWYLANHLGRRFLGAAATLLPGLTGLGTGLWRAVVLGHPLYLVSNRDAPVERDTLPIHLLVREPVAATQAVAEELATHGDLWPLYGGWLAVLLPALWEEVCQMARRSGYRGPAFDFGPAVEHFGLEEFIRQLGMKRMIDEWGLKRVVDEVGLKRVVDEVGLKRVVDEVGPQRILTELGVDAIAAGLTPKQRRDLLRVLQRDE